MPESFGARLRQRREEQQIALTTITEQTKISVALLEALERDDVSRWPAGIFRRAFIRAYAHAIGLEPEVVVREFLELHPDPIEVVATLPATAPDVGVSVGPPTRLQHLAGSAMSSLSGLRRRLVQKRTPPVAVERVVAGDSTSVEVEDVAATDGTSADVEDVEATDCTSVHAPVRSEPDLLAAANLCTSFGRVGEASEAAPLLEEAVRILDAVGLIVWVWDPQAAKLIPALGHGYSDKVLAQLPPVGRDTDNATAAAFRLAQACVVSGGGLASGALVLPLMTPAGCAGVLAIELQHGDEQRDSVRALATILAAQLATLIERARPGEAASRRRA